MPSEASLIDLAKAVGLKPIWNGVGFHLLPHPPRALLVVQFFENEVIGAITIPASKAEDFFDGVREFLYELA